MITANEIHIGNILLHENSNTIVMVDSIHTFHGINIEIHSDVDVFGFDFYSLVGIPLTEDWLLKFGFDQKYLPSDNYGGWLITIPTINRLRLLIKDGEYYFDFGPGKAKVEFVHQLQNLYFALIGKELTIN